MNLEIFPYEGMGSIKLGMTQSEVRNAVTSKFETFMKSRTSKMPTDDFIGQGIHVYYKPPGICNAIEVAAPANPTFQGYRLMAMPFSQLSAYFQSQDPAVEIDDNGLTSKLFGLGLYAPDLDESPDAPIKGVIVFERGYYDNEAINAGEMPA